MPHIQAPISKATLLRQYLRWLPAQLGLVNKAAYILQIADIKPADTFIVSYPKSGNTWLRFIVAYLRNANNNKITLQDLEKMAPDVYTSKEIIDSLQSPRFIKSHHPLYKYYPRMIYIYRDYRDVLVSYYRYKTALNEYAGSFSDFMRSDEVQQPFGNWREHVSAALERAEHDKVNTLLLSYEGLSNNFEKEITRIASFIGVKADIDRIKDLTGFETLKATENETGSWFKALSGQNFFNEGSIGSWKNFFSNKDITYLQSNKQLDALLSRLNYKW